MLLLVSAANATQRRQYLEGNFMPHCTKCGTMVDDNVAFCPSCGAPQAGGVATAMAPAASTQSGLSENVAGLLCYVLGWITGIIFFLIDKRPYVRFHAAQSIVTFGGLHIIRIVLAMIFGVGWMFGGFGHVGHGGWGGFGIGLMLLTCLSLLSFVLWIVCMIKAATGTHFEVPIAGPIAENLAR